MLENEMPFSALDLFNVRAGGEAASASATAVDILTAGGVCESKGEAKRAVKQGAVSLNEVRVNDEGHVLTREDLLYGKYIFIRIGKKRFHLVRMD